MTAGFFKRVDKAFKIEIGITKGILGGKASKPE